MGDRLARAATAGERVLLATGHPVGLALFYRALEGLLVARGARLVTPAAGARWHEGHLDHDWVIAYFGAVACSSTIASRATRTARRRWSGSSTDVHPDLVVADHGFAGAAIEAGVETLSIADVNDPALIVAKAQGRTDVVVVMDDHVSPDDYWPCFQAVAEAF